MNSINILNDTSKSNKEKLDAVGAIRDSLDFASVTEKEAIGIINELVQQVIKQQETDIKESILGAMIDGYCSYDVEKSIDLEPIVDQIQSFNEQCLGYILTLLGWSGKEKYRDLIISFSDNLNLTEDIEEALSELDHRINQM